MGSELSKILLNMVTDDLNLKKLDQDIKDITVIQENS